MVSSISKDFETLIQTNTPLIAVESGDEPRVVELVKKLAVQHFRPVFRWSVTDGLMAFASTYMAPSPSLTDPALMLREIRKRSDSGIYLLCDFASYLTDVIILRLIKDIALYQKDVTLILLDPNILVPDDLKYKMAHITLALPDPVQLNNKVIREARNWNRTQPDNKNFSINDAKLEEMASNLKGYSNDDAHDCMHHLISEQNVLACHSQAQSQARKELLNLNNFLHYQYDPVSVKTLGGAKEFKRWFKENIKSVLQNKAEKPALTGALLYGQSGLGKKQAVKSMAAVLKIPLLILNPGFLLAKTESSSDLSRHFESVMKNAQSIGPCLVLLPAIDQFLQQEQSQELIIRFVQFVQWHFRKTSKYFLAVTCDHQSNLPAEIYANHLFNQTIEFSLPDESEREQITKIHLTGRGLASFQVDPKAIAAYSDGLTGEEIEKALVMAIHRFCVGDQDLNTEMVLQALDHLDYKVKVPKLETEGYTEPQVLNG